MKTKHFFTFFMGMVLPFAFLLAMTTCSKKEETTTSVSVPTITTKTPTNITQNSASVGGYISSDGRGTVSERGICYGTSQNPTVADLTIVEGGGTGTFTCDLTGLSSNTKYYAKAYGINSTGVGYGSQVSFTTLGSGSGGLPTVTTATISNPTQNSATGGGNVTDDGGSSVTQKGVCWSTSQNPTISGNHTNDGSGTGTFTSDITGLNASTTYYVCAYATNGSGTGYGSQVSFTTTGSGTIPTVATNSVTNPTQTTATCGGIVASQGSSTVTARGVCWSTSQNPTTSDSFTTDGTGTGSFTSNLTGLSAGTSYYVRAYATNAAGTAYGGQRSFTTTGSSGGQPCPGVPTVTYEGKVYNTVLIGTQCWLKENLNVGTRVNGAQDQLNNGIKEKYCFNDLESNCDIYGGLYQWEEMMQYVTTEGAKGICPTGWHIPTDAEWYIMTTFLGGENIAGGKLKETGTIHWFAPNTGATNETGFTALPGGIRHLDATFYFKGYGAYIWTSTSFGSSNSKYRHLYYYDQILERLTQTNKYGHSVRCLKD